MQVAWPQCQTSCARDAVQKPRLLSATLQRSSSKKAACSNCMGMELRGQYPALLLLGLCHGDQETGLLFVWGITKSSSALLPAESWSSCGLAEQPV